MAFRQLITYLFVLFLCLLCGVYSLFGQEESIAKQTIEDLIEEIASSTDAELDYSSLYESLNYFLNNPINLNNTSVEELERLQFLSDFQIKSVLDYIQTNGAMLSIYELQLVYGFTMQDIINLLPFVTVASVETTKKVKWDNALKYGTHQVFMRGQTVLEQQEGFAPISDSLLAIKPNSRYLGGAYKLYAKYKYNYKDKIYWGITAENDAGEEFFKGSNKNGFDFYSFHLQLNDISIFKTITIGDFQPKFGQGLILWSDMGISKTPYIMNIRKKAQGISKYASTNENYFMRGAGTTVKLMDFNISAFYSNKKIDANIQDSTDNEIASVSAFQESGLHSVPSEIEDENSIREQIIGANISYNHKFIKAGITGINYNYSASLIKDTSVINQFDFRGNENTNLSLDFLVTLGKINLFGEEAYSINGGKAFLNGVLVNPAPQIAFSVLHRYYERNFQANYGNAFTEGSKNSNESGIYFGLEVHPIKKWAIRAYFDSYKFPWLKTGADAPSQGYEWFAQAEFVPTRNLDLYFRIKNEIKSVNQETIAGIDKMGEQQKLALRFHINYRLNEQLVLKNRIETAKYKESQQNTEYGYMIYQDIFYTLKGIPLSFNLRYAIFDTDSYDTRIYAYESDILYAFSIPAYYSKGTRTYFNLKYSVSNYIDIWVKYAQTYYSDLDVISSGLSQINGNTKSEIKVQLRIKL